MDDGGAHEHGVNRVVHDEVVDVFVVFPAAVAEGFVAGEFLVPGFEVLKEGFLVWAGGVGVVAAFEGFLVPLVGGLFFLEGTGCGEVAGVPGVFVVGAVAGDSESVGEGADVFGVFDGGGVFSDEGGDGVDGGGVGVCHGRGFSFLVFRTVAGFS